MQKKVSVGLSRFLYNYDSLTRLLNNPLAELIFLLFDPPVDFHSLCYQLYISIMITNKSFSRSNCWKGQVRGLGMKFYIAL